MDKLLFCLLDNSASFATPCDAARARELTIAWTRFKYSGIILEHSDPDELLRQASKTDAGCCVVQSYGYLLEEVWRPEEGEVPGIISAIRHWLESSASAVAGLALPAGDWPGRGALGFFLVDLSRYRQLGCPTFEHLLGVQREDGLAALPHAVARHVVHLDPAESATWGSDPAPQENAQGAAAVECSAAPAHEGNEFVAATRALSRQLRRAVFVWNIESYADVETPPARFTPPLQTLYTVSAGFKPNRMLHTHGFSADSRMVVFDYSRQGLEYRRLLHEDWDGQDYPGFLRQLFQHLPPGDTHYLLWDGASPDDLDWNEVEARWQQELAVWGGAEALYQHWQRFRQITVEYLHCDLLEQQDLLLDRIDATSDSLIWWSNAFFSVYSIWHYSAERRRAIYRRWVRGLARRAPALLVHGSDCNNASVNGYSAAEYATWLDTHRPYPLDELRPAGLKLRQMRY